MRAMAERANTARRATVLWLGAFAGAAGLSAQVPTPSVTDATFSPSGSDLLLSHSITANTNVSDVWLWVTGSFNASVTNIVSWNDPRTGTEVIIGPGTGLVSTSATTLIADIPHA